MKEKETLLYKKEIIAQLVIQLESELQTMQQAAAVAREAATHEESVAEDKYDTRGLEASYLAGAQARRAHELELIIEGLKNLRVAEYSEKCAIGQTCLVELEFNDKRAYFFMAPNGGGISVEIGSQKIQIVTPSSRLGALLLGKFVDDSFELKVGEKVTEYRVVKIS